MSHDLYNHISALPAIPYNPLYGDIVGGSVRKLTTMSFKHRGWGVFMFPSKMLCAVYVTDYGNFVVHQRQDYAATGEYGWYVDTPKGTTAKFFENVDIVNIDELRFHRLTDFIHLLSKMPRSKVVDYIQF